MIIFVLLLIAMSSGMMITGIGAPMTAFIYGLILYFAVLGVIFFQNKVFKRFARRNKSAMLTITNIELLVFLIIYHFILGSQRLFNDIFPNFQTPILIFSLLLYLFGIWVFHFTSYDSRRVLQGEEAQTSAQHAFLQLRMIIPFILPFLFFTIAIDLLKWVPNENLQDILVRNTNNVTGSLILLVGTLIFMLIMLMLMPVFIQKIWLCKPLENLDLLKRLENLCAKARFKHAGIETWTVMNNSLTAAIVGIVPRFRYIIFTKRILRELSPDAIEAILAHEIGHSYRKHLLIYPLIILGMIIVTGIFSLLLSDATAQFIELEYLLHPSEFWEFLYPLLVFIPYILIIGLYFRFVFGFFSRLFERQADLHVFKLGVSPDFMIEALNDIAVSSGNIHSLPSWHHFSIQQRINFLEEAKKDPRIIIKHHARVKKYVLGYFVLLIVGSLIFLSPFLPETDPFKQINTTLIHLRSSISNNLNASLINSTANAFMNRYNLIGDQVLIRNALKDSIRGLATAEIPGLIEFEAAKTLFNEGQLSASAVLMAHVWKAFDLNSASPEIRVIFSYWTQQILEKISEKKEYQSEYNLLNQAYRRETEEKKIEN